MPQDRPKNLRTFGARGPLKQWEEPPSPFQNPGYGHDALGKPVTFYVIIKMRHVTIVAERSTDVTTLERNLKVRPGPREDLLRFLLKGPSVIDRLEWTIEDDEKKARTS
ncbi:hypothetical protein Bbelb_268430 [Branchiostoma belcheri]|nr:hypothetical protein Bbelb_268430 [Branchiostoma belcheri]